MIARTLGTVRYSVCKYLTHCGRGISAARSKRAHTFSVLVSLHLIREIPLGLELLRLPPYAVIVKGCDLFESATQAHQRAITVDHTLPMYTGLVNP